MTLGHELRSYDDLTLLARSRGVRSWVDLVDYIAALPYGRNKNRSDFGLVLYESKGTCSSKHALLKLLADINKVPDIRLILGIYRMSKVNTPKIGDTLSTYGLDYIPEAHCYLQSLDQRYDYTATDSNFARIQDDVLVELEIQPNQVVTFKVEYHQKYIRQWIIDHGLPFSFDQVWSLREECIQQLTGA